MKFLLSIIFLISAELSAQQIEYSRLSDTLPVNNITQAEADSIFRFITAQSDMIEFADCNICKSRAHIMGRVIEKHFAGVTVAKAWLFADCRRLSQREKYKYKAEVFLAGGNCDNWGYHVAPVIITPKDTFVIDPATQKTAVKLGDWARGITPQNGKAFLVVKHAGYFIYPDDKDDHFEDQKSVWGEENESLTDENYSRSIDEMTRTSLGLIEPWKMRERVEKIRHLLE